MPFINELLKYDSISIVGLEKNTGKTETLNYILKRLPLSTLKVAVTSIGIDGENKDMVTGTGKPEIYLREGVYFSTAEAHYKLKRAVCELVDITDERSSLGRIVTSKVILGGKVLISGPSSGLSLQRWCNSVKELGVDLSIIDGAISRLSSASPAISKAMVLSTGAAYSSNLRTLISKTKYITQLVGLDLASEFLREQFTPIYNGVYGVDDNNRVVDFKLLSSLSISSVDKSLLKSVKTFYLSGALTDGFIKVLMGGGDIRGVKIVVRDFTKIFVEEMLYKSFISGGGTIEVLQKSKLIAVTINPIAPNGYMFNSDFLCEQLQQAIELPVYDIVKNKYEL